MQSSPRSATRATFAWCLALNLIHLPVATYGAGLVINEFMAINDTAYINAIGDYSDWIEIYNDTGSHTNLVDWYLTDNPEELQKWQFPSASITAGGYLLVFADGSNAVLQSELHSNFKLNGNGEYLALVKPDGATIVHQYAPEYPEQSPDVSYGLDTNGVERYFQDPTPGLSNTSGLAEAVNFSRTGGVFTNSFSLYLTAESSNALIRYTLDGSIPTNSSATYTSGNPLSITITTQVRAKVYEAGLDPGPTVSHAYFALNAEVWNFSSALPIVVADTFGYDIDSEADQHAEYPISPAYVVFIDRDPTGRASLTGSADFIGRAGMKVRGNATRIYNLKKSYSLETWDDKDKDRSVSLFGFPSESDWVLYGPYMDKTLMRNYITYKWSGRMGRYASRTLFVELFLNSTLDVSNISSNDYRGVYVFAEKIKRDNNRVNIAALDPTDNAEPEITGGYIFKGDSNNPGASGFSTPMFPSVKLQYVDPGEGAITPQQRTWLTGYIAEFEAALFDPTFTNQVTGKGYSEYIDVRSFLDRDIIFELTKNIDGWSTYMFKDRGAKIVMEPVWDYNTALGNRYQPPFGGHLPEGWNSYFYEHPFYIKWWPTLYQDPDYYQQRIDRWTDLRRGKLSTESIMSDIDDIAALVDEAQARNFMRWPILGQATTYAAPGYADRDTYQKEVDWMKDWLSNRVDWIDSQFLVAAEFNQNGGLVTTDFALILTAPAGTVYYTVDGSDPRDPNGNPAPNAHVYEGQFSLSESTVVRARAWDGLWTTVHTDPSENPFTLNIPWSGLTEAVFRITPPTLAVTEIMYHPQIPMGAETSYTASDFEFIELKNVGTETTSLLGVEFIGGITFDFTYGSVTNLAAGDYVVAVRNLAAFKIRYPNWAGINIAGKYLGGLDDGGEQITLRNSLNQTNSFSYNNAWFPGTDGEGFSLTVIAPESGDLDRKSEWRHSAYRNGSPGEEDPDLFAPPGSVVINEVLSHQDNEDPGDWIELHNTTTGPIAIGDWFLSDTSTNLTKFPVPSGTILPANGYIVFTEYSDFGTHALGVDGFALSEHGDTVYLSAGTNGMPAEPAYRESEDFGAAERNVTLGRYTKSDDSVDFTAMSAPTPNGVNAYPLVGPVVISEVMYHPEEPGSFEFIELYNVTGSDVDLADSENPANTWKLTGAIDFMFPPDVVIGATNFVLVVPTDANTFRSVYTSVPAGVEIYGPYSGQLDNAGESIRLFKPGEPEPAFVPNILVERVEYDDKAPWPSVADGNGPSLHRIITEDYGNDNINWMATGDGGSPGLSLPKVSITSPEIGDDFLIPFSTTIKVAVNSNRLVGSVHEVQFFEDTNIICVVSNAPYECTLDYIHITNAGTYTLMARLVDDAGTNISPAVLVTASEPVRVTISSPAEGESLILPFSSLITVAIDSNRVVGSVHAVEFFEDTNSLGVVYDAPYEWVLDNITNAGVYTLSAKMKDDFKTSTSPGVGITVYTNQPSALIDTKDQTLAILDPVLLNATVDGDGLPTELVATLWTKYTGPGMVAFGDPSAPNTTASFPEAAGIYTLSLTTTFGSNLTLTDYVTITVIGSNTLNRIPYRESFEKYDNGTRIAGMQGWHAGDRHDAAVVTNDYSIAYSGAYPLMEEPHELVLEIDGPVTNRFENTEEHTKVWIDMMFECKPWEQELPPQLQADVQFGVYVNTNSRLLVWHCPDPAGQPSANAWTELTETNVGPDEWIRLTLEVDYERDVNGFFHFRLWTNGVAVTNTYDWFAAANTNNSYFSGLSTRGNFHLDDLVVENYNTLDFKKITASAGLYGIIDPSGEVLVDVGGAMNFDMIATDYYHVADIVIDGAQSMGAITNYTFTNVTANHTIDAGFSADLAANATPVWWLVQYGLGTNVADVIRDDDGDGLLNWEEYVLGTVPLTSLSRFDIEISESNGTVVVHYNTVAADGAGYKGVDRYYDLQDCSDLTPGPWQPVPGYTNVVGDGSPVLHTNTAGDPVRSYRVKAWLE